MTDEVRRRLMRLRDGCYGVFREHPALGPVEEELHWMRCDGCGVRIELDASKAFIDLPEQLEGWARVDERDLCPRCAP
jgi:hypothetical protein